MTDAKICTKCGVLQPLTEYGRKKSRKGTEGWASHCRKCHRAYNKQYLTDETKRARANERCKQWLERNRDLNRARSKNNYVTRPDEYRNRIYRKLYGIGLVEYNEMYNTQKGLCQICSRGFPRLAIDHCHQSGVIRALLCQTCNKGLGLFYEGPDTLMAAVDYVEHHSKTDCGYIYDRTNRTKLFRKHGIALAVYDLYYSCQKGLCAICKRSSKLVVDHCHESELVRALLCQTCNQGIGLFRDNPIWLCSAASYLTRFTQHL